MKKVETAPLKAINSLIAKVQKFILKILDLVGCGPGGGKISSWVGEMFEKGEWCDVYIYFLLCLFSCVSSLVSLLSLLFSLSYSLSLILTLSLVLTLLYHSLSLLSLSYHSLSLITPSYIHSLS